MRRSIAAGLLGLWTALSPCDALAADEGAATAGETAAGDTEAVADDPFAVLEEPPPPDYADIDSYPDPQLGEDAATGAAGAGAAAAKTPGGDVATLAVEDGESFGDHAARAGEVTMDVLVLRPFGALSTGVGGAFLLVASPLLLASGEYDEAYDTFLAERARYTFERPLGEF